MAIETHRAGPFQEIPLESLKGLIDVIFMAQTKKKSNHFDITLIGAGLSNLYLAHKFSQSDLRVALITEDNGLGDRYRSFRSNNQIYSQCFHFTPFGDLSGENFLQNLSNDWKEEITSQWMPVEFITFENGRLQTFLGFGENKPETIEPLSPYINVEKEWRFNLAPAAWVRRLELSAPFHLFSQQTLTRFDVENKKITGFTLNGAKKYTTSAVVFGESLRTLKNLFEPGVLNSRTLTRLSKVPTWVGVHLFIKHSERVTDSEHIHILRGSKSEPCIGRFEYQTSTHSSLSRWLTFLSSEMAEDEEITGQAFREIKKQIKRAYPQAIENTEFERLYIEPTAFMDPSGIAPEGQIPAIENLWLTGPGFHSESLAFGEISWAEQQWLKMVDQLSEETSLQGRKESRIDL